MASPILPRLYDRRFFVAAALRSMGRVLPAKTIVEMIPAITGRDVFIDRDSRRPHRRSHRLIFATFGR